MFRTQIYLTKEQSDALAALSQATGRTQDELVREAVNRLIEEVEAAPRDVMLERAAGLWKDRDDLPDFQQLRRGWDRTSD